MKTRTDEIKELLKENTDEINKAYNERREIDVLWELIKDRVRLELEWAEIDMNN